MGWGGGLDHQQEPLIMWCLQQELHVMQRGSKEEKHRDDWAWTHSSRCLLRKPWVGGPEGLRHSHTDLLECIGMVQMMPECV